MDEQKPEENIKTIHTYSSDLADAVRQNEVSVIKVALAEQKKHEREAENTVQAEGGTRSSKVVWLISALVLIAIASAVVYIIFKQKTAPVAPTQQTALETRALIAYDDQAFIDLSNATSSTDTFGILTTEIDRGMSMSGIKALFLTRSTTTGSEILPVEKLLSLLKITAPSALIRSFDTNYFFGTYRTVGTDSPVHPFLLLQTKDFNQSYAGMLGWEKTMLRDLFPLFDVDISGTRQDLFDKQWKDIVINNRNARILYDKEGNDVLYYMFINNDSIIITNSQDTIKEVVTRLLTKKTKPL